MNLLILQERPHKAGAQYALLRTLRTKAFQKTSPLVILSERGWLTEQFEKNNIPYLITPFPSARSLPGKLFKNRLFIRRVSQQIKSFTPEIILANDHGECLLSLALAKHFQTPSAAFLRTPGMTQRDFNKYHCDAFDLLLTIGDELHARVSSWSKTPQKVHPTYDGVEEDEFRIPPPPAPTSFPTRWLIIGGAAPRKGWQDFAKAIRIAEQTPHFPKITCDFTSEKPNPIENDMKLDLPRRATFNFIGKVDHLAETAQQYGLCVHPSRAETFGLAGAEIIAAGIPLLASKTGILPLIQANESMTFSPSSPKSMAQCFIKLHKEWKTMDLKLQESQELLHSQFSINVQGDIYLKKLQSLLN